MKLYEIDAQIEAILQNVDAETGEVIVDTEALTALQMERDAKLENIALYYKDMMGDAEKLKNEIDALKARYDVTKRTAESLKNYLTFALAGEAFKSPRVACSWRTSEVVELSEDFIAWATKNGEQFLRYKDPEPDKTAIKAALKEGQTVFGAELVKKTNLTVK